MTAISANKGSKVVGTVELDQAVKPATDKVNAYMTMGKQRGAGGRSLLGEGARIWVVTFKPGDLIPADLTTQFIGAGGELIVTVDLKTKESELTHGE